MEWTQEKPRILTKEVLQFDPLYTGDILKAQEVKIIGASNNFLIFRNQLVLLVKKFLTHPPTPLD
jgi:hypothetical protein